MKIISKAEAIKLGLKTYYTGKRCPNGHIDVIYVNGRCRTCKLEGTNKSRAKAKAQTGKIAKSKAVAVIPPKKLYDGGVLPPWMARYGEWIRKDLVSIEDYYIGIAAKLAKVKEASTARGFKEFCQEFGIGRSRAYEMLAIADGRTTIEEVREAGRVRAKRFYEERKARPLVTDSPEVALVPHNPQPGDNVIEAEAADAEIIEETPPPAVAAKPEPGDVRDDVLDYAVIHLEGAVDRILGAERHPFDKLVAALSDSTPEKLEKAAAILMRLADAIRRKAAA